MTAAEADKLRAMCEQVILRRCTSWNGFLNDTAEIARALLELLPAEGERELRKRGDDAEPRVQARLAAYLEAEHKPIHQDGPSRSMPLVRQPGGEGRRWRDISTAKKDGTPVLLKIVDVIPGAVPDTNSHRLQGIQFVGRNMLAKNGNDYGWNFAAPVGYGGIPDEWIEGYQPLPAPPSAAPAPAAREDG